MRFLTPLMFIIAGIIHLLPLAGVLGAERLQMLYGITVSDPNLEIILRHRAVMFGIVGGYLCVAAFRPEMQINALVIGFLSVLTFIGLALLVGQYNEQIRRVIVADVVALVCLVIATVMVALKHRQQQ